MIVSTYLVLVVRGQFLVLPVEKLAVLSGETPSRGVVELADASWFRSRWSFHVQRGRSRSSGVSSPSVGEIEITLYCLWIINCNNTP